jgi:hypothetical protein
MVIGSMAAEADLRHNIYMVAFIKRLHIHSARAKTCRSLVRKVLMRGGAAYLTVKGAERTLFHKPMIHAPMTKLSWPFSVHQMHDVELRVADSTGRRLRPNKRFSREGISEAIDSFLEGCSLEDEVRVEFERRRGWLGEVLHWIKRLWYRWIGNGPVFQGAAQAVSQAFDWFHRGSL